jgi:phosphoribosylaminoimidazolecarboxamide formyltransferase/IMP cyclohydrolase
MDTVAVRRALVSVSDKTGVAEFAGRLNGLGIQILSTGGTARLLSEQKVPVTPVEEYTGSPEIMDGRVKTLHPRIHGGILAIRDNQSHRDQMGQQGIEPIDIVAVNLYPFKQTIARPDVTVEEAIENIDIGGPTMVRSAAKNHRYVTIIVDPDDYPVVADEIETNNGVTMATRQRLALKAFRHTAEYDTSISEYLASIYQK